MKKSFTQTATKRLNMMMFEVLVKIHADRVIGTSTQFVQASDSSTAKKMAEKYVSEHIKANDIKVSTWEKQNGWSNANNSIFIQFIAFLMAPFFRSRVFKIKVTPELDGKKLESYTILERLKGKAMAKDWGVKSLQVSVTYHAEIVKVIKGRQLAQLRKAPKVNV